MYKTFVRMPSVTHAMSAKKLLSAKGLRCDIKRSIKASKNGCSHYIIVNADEGYVRELLDSYSIPYTGISGEAVDG